MSDFSASAVAHPNIAFIKYWGNRDELLRIPLNGSISMNLAGLDTRTQVTFDPEYEQDCLILNNQPTGGAVLDRVSHFLDLVRNMAHKPWYAQVTSENNFPTGAGIASSAAAFAALSLAATRAVGLQLSQKELSRLARRGSGSACRSVPSGFVEWLPGQSDNDSYAISLAPPEHWDLVDCIAVLQVAHKPVGSSEGHSLAATSPLQEARVKDTPRRLAECRQALLSRDFDRLAQIAELDSNLMHAVMMTSNPPLFYWEPVSLEIMKAIPAQRQKGLPVFYTLDAGPNVHVICTAESHLQVKKFLLQFPGVVQVLTAFPGGPASFI